MRTEDTPGRDRGRGALLEWKRQRTGTIQTKFEVCRLATMRFYSLVPADVESHDKGLRHYIKN